jgi:hypothetical protein
VTCENATLAIKDYENVNSDYHLFLHAANWKTSISLLASG